MIDSWVDILAIIILLDSIGGLWVAWFGQRWFIHHMGILAKYIPPAKGWVLWYFILALLLVAVTQGWVS